MASPKATFVITAVDRTQAAFKSVNSSLSQTATEAAKVTAAIGAIGAGLANVARSVARFGDTTQLLGLSSVESFQEIAIASREAGQSFETTAMGIQRLARRAQEAREGNEQLVAAFNAFGISAAELAAYEPDLLFRKMADGLEDARDQGVDLSNAMRVLDSEGLRLLLTMERLNEDGFQETMQLMQDTGSLIDDELVANSRKLAGEWDVMMEGLKVQAAQVATEMVWISDQIWQARRQAQAWLTEAGQAVTGMQPDTSGFDEAERVAKERTEKIAAAQREARLRALEQQHTDEVMLEETKNQRLEELARQHTQFVMDQDDRQLERDNENADAQQAGRMQMWGSLTQAAARNSQLMFQIDKARALAQGALQTKEAVLGAYAWGTKIGGPPFGAAMAAVAGAAGATYLASIASSSYGASTSASTGGGGGSSETPTEQAGGSGLQTFNVEFRSGTGLYDERSLRGLFDAIERAAEDGGPNLSGRFVVEGI